MVATRLENFHEVLTGLPTLVPSFHHLIRDFLFPPLWMENTSHAKVDGCLSQSKFTRFWSRGSFLLHWDRSWRDGTHVRTWRDAHTWGGDGSNSGWRLSNLLGRVRRFEDEIKAIAIVIIGSRPRAFLLSKKSGQSLWLNLFGPMWWSTDPGVGQDLAPRRNSQQNMG